MPSPRSYTSFPSDADLFYSCTTSSTSAEDLNLRYVPASKSSLKIGVIILSQDPTQLLGLCGLDLLAMMSRSRLSKLNASDNVLDTAVDEIDIRYVTASGEGSFPISCGARIPVTNSFENAPQFDILFVPGSFSTTSLPASVLAFFTSQCSHPGFIALMSIVSGILHIVQAGILHKRRATAPRTLLPALKQRYPDIAWQSAPWIRHEKIWSNDSAISSLDMIRSFLREYFWDRSDAVEHVLNVAGIGLLDECE